MRSRVGGVNESGTRRLRSGMKESSGGFSRDRRRGLHCAPSRGRDKLAGAQGGVAGSLGLGAGQARVASEVGRSRHVEEGRELGRGGRI